MASLVLPPTQEVYIERRILEVFNDPKAVKIASCESSLRQYTNGTTTRGKLNPDDLGTFQVNQYYHGQKAQELGLDLHSIEGNIQYAKYLYDKNGWRDWGWSKHCWEFP